MLKTGVKSFGTFSTVLAVSVSKADHRHQQEVMMGVWLTFAAFLSSLLAAHWVYALPLAGRFSISRTAARRALSCHSLSAPSAVLQASSASLRRRTNGESLGDTVAPAETSSLQ